MKNKLWLKRCLILLIIVVALASLEFFVFSFKGLTLNKDNALTDFEALKDGKTVSLKSYRDYTYSLDFAGGRVFNLVIGSVTKNGNDANKPIKVEVIGRDTKLSEYNMHLKSGYIAPGKDDSSYQTIQLDASLTESSCIYIKFSDVSVDTIITSICVNSTQDLIGINPVRLIIAILTATAVWAFVVLNLHKEYFDIKRKKHLIVGIITVVFLCIDCFDFLRLLFL